MGSYTDIYKTPGHILGYQRIKLVSSDILEMALVVIFEGRDLGYYKMDAKICGMVVVKLVD